MNAVSGLLLSVVALTHASNGLAADNSVQLDTVEVFSSQSDGAYIEQADDIAERLQSVPGGTNLIPLEQASKLSTLSDALNYQPGIIVQEFFGGLDQPRLNVRGSGIQGNPVSRGVLLRQNYLPLNDADGSFIIGLINLRDTAMITAHRGANSRAPGSFTLGGDINFILNHGVASENAEAQAKAAFETGSFGQQTIHAAYSSGASSWNWHASLSEAHADGYRHHSASRREQYHLNLSAKLNDRISNYSYFNYTDMAFEMPFVLPKAYAESDPTAVYGDGVPISGLLPDDLVVPDFINIDAVANEFLNMYRRDPHRSTQHTRLANRTTILTANSEHNLGWYWQHTDDAFVDPFSHIETDSHTLGAQWIFDAYPNEFLHYQAAIDVNQSDMPRTYTGNHPLLGSKIEPSYADLDLYAKNTALSLLFDLTLLPQLTLSGQWQVGRSRRNVTNRTNSEHYSGQWHYSLPKLGLIYYPDQSDSRWFMNISNSIELPTFWEIIGVDVNPLLTWMSQAQIQELSAQRATTLELGTEQQITDALSWQLALFISEVEHELISTASQFGVIAETSNYAGDTIHQGIEFGFNGHTRLRGHHAVRYRGSWTFSDFYFKNGALAGNQIAGVPKNVIMLEALLQQGKTSFGPNLYWVPDDKPVDHANSLGQGRFLIVGFNVNYEFESYLRCYVNVSNLTDETYNASFVVRAQSNENMPTFLPGNGTGINVGMQLLL